MAAEGTDPLIVAAITATGAAVGLLLKTVYDNYRKNKLSDLGIKKQEAGLQKTQLEAAVEMYGRTVTLNQERLNAQEEKINELNLALMAAVKAEAACTERAIALENGVQSLREELSTISIRLAMMKCKYCGRPILTDDLSHSQTKGTFNKEKRYVIHIDDSEGDRLLIKSTIKSEVERHGLTFISLDGFQQIAKYIGDALIVIVDIILPGGGSTSAEHIILWKDFPEEVRPIIAVYTGYADVKHCLPPDIPVYDKNNIDSREDLRRYVLEELATYKERISDDRDS